jgi:hypothetical protein
MNARKLIASAAATLCLGTALVAVNASSALAAPTGCTYQLNTAERWVSGFCSGGTGELRIRALQKHFLAEVGWIPIIGPWVPAGSESRTAISSHQTVSVWVETR